MTTESSESCPIVLDLAEDIVHLTLKLCSGLTAGGRAKNVRKQPHENLWYGESAAEVECES
jgi:hypothetical protein